MLRKTMAGLVAVFFLTSASHAKAETKVSGEEILSLFYGLKLSISGGGCGKRYESGRKEFQFKYMKNGVVLRKEFKSGEVTKGKWFIENDRFCTTGIAEAKHCDEYRVFGKNNYRYKLFHHEEGKEYSPSIGKVSDYAAAFRCEF